MSTLACCRPSRVQLYCSLAVSASGVRRPVWLPSRRRAQCRRVRAGGVLCAGGSEASAAASLDEVEFSSMLERLRAWKEKNYDCIVPRKVRREAAPVYLPGGGGARRKLLAGLPGLMLALVQH